MPLQPSAKLRGNRRNEVDEDEDQNEDQDFEVNDDDDRELFAGFVAPRITEGSSISRGDVKVKVKNNASSTSNNGVTLAASMDKISKISVGTSSSHVGSGGGSVSKGAAFSGIHAQEFGY